MKQMKVVQTMTTIMKIQMKIFKIQLNQMMIFKVKKKPLMPGSTLKAMEIIQHANIVRKLIQKVHQLQF